MVSINGIGNTNKGKQALSCLSYCIKDKVLDKVHMLRIRTIVYGLSSVGKSQLGSSRLDIKQLGL